MAFSLLSKHLGVNCRRVKAEVDLSKLGFNLERTKPLVKETRPTPLPTEIDRPRILYDRKEAARLLSVSVRTIDRLIGTKALAARRVGRSVLIPHVELMKLSRRDVLSV
jgi:excisionase family DNA binding protein